MKTKEKSLIHIIGVNHSFGKIAGETSNMPYKQVFNSIKILLEKGELISGKINMNNNF